MTATSKTFEHKALQALQELAESKKIKKVTMLKYLAGFQSPESFDLRKGDKKHLHHRLLKLGWGQTPIVLLYVTIATAFGVSALFLQSQEKLVALLILSLIMGLGALLLVQKDRHA